MYTLLKLTLKSFINSSNAALAILILILFSQNSLKQYFPDPTSKLMQLFSF